MTSLIYFDYNASTPVATEVVDAMRPYWEGFVGNPSSQHWAGLPYKGAMILARKKVASFLGCSADEVIFTSGGSEANNLAIKGAFFANSHKGKHIIISNIEHPSVTAPCEFLRRFGANITYLPVDESGRVKPDDVKKAITADTILISLMHANNEIGTIQPIGEVAKIACHQNILLHTDAAQSAGKIPINVVDLGVDLLTLAGHKFYGPKGIGALFVRKGVSLEPLIHGAGHEKGLRAGTEPIPVIVGLGAACDLAKDLRDVPRIKALRDRLQSLLKDEFGNRVTFNGRLDEGLPNTLSVSFADASADRILSKMPNVAASTGSACHSGSEKMSPVLHAIGLPSYLGFGTIRFSLGRNNNDVEIEQLVTDLVRVVER